jgi:hypothetical protein
MAVAMKLTKKMNNTNVGAINQYDALFFCTLLRYHASTCFGPICSPSSGGRVYSAASGIGFTAKSTDSRPVQTWRHGQVR